MTVAAVIPLNVVLRVLWSTKNVRPPSVVRISQPDGNGIKDRSSDVLPYGKRIKNERGESDKRRRTSENSRVAIIQHYPDTWVLPLRDLVHVIHVVGTTCRGSSPLPALIRWMIAQRTYEIQCKKRGERGAIYEFNIH